MTPLEEDDRPPRRPRHSKLSPPPICGGCGKPAKLVDARSLGAKPVRAKRRAIWRCDDCSAHVGCHPGTTRPLGTLAPASVRRARQDVHDLIDPLWKSAPDHYPGGFASGQSEIMRMARERVYSFLGDRLGLPRDRCYVGEFDLATCKRAILALEGVTYPQIREHSHRRLRSGVG